MTFQTIIAFFTFIIICGITPGPANLTCLAASLQYGRKIAFRQWLGLVSGSLTDALVSVMIVFFLGTALNGYVQWFSLAGALYLTFLSLKMLKRTYSADRKSIQETGFMTGFILNITNAKIILICVTALSSYVLPFSEGFAVLLSCGLCAGIIFPLCNLVWLFLGLSLQKFFAGHQKTVNIVMSIALFYCAVKLALVPFLD